MLVQFKSDVGGFTMFGDIAQRLLRMSGHSGTVPGAIPAEGVADALAQLRAALARLDPEPDKVEAPANGAPEKDPPVPLQRRAFPMVELMEKAVGDGCGIHWDTP